MAVTFPVTARILVVRSQRVEEIETSMKQNVAMKIIIFEHMSTKTVKIETNNVPNNLDSDWRKYWTAPGQPKICGCLLRENVYFLSIKDQNIYLGFSSIRNLV